MEGLRDGGTEGLSDGGKGALAPSPSLSVSLSLSPSVSPSLRPSVARCSASAAAWIVLTLHGTLNLALYLLPWYFEKWTLLLVQTLPFAQVSLLGWWAALSTRQFYLRFAAAAVGTAAAWLVLVAVLPLVSVRSTVAAGLLLALSTQGLLTLLGVVLMRAIRPGWAFWLDERDDENPRVQYDIRSLLLLTAVVALLMGLLQVVARGLAWQDAVQWEYFALMPALGTYYALLALLVLAALAGRKRAAGRAARVAGALAIVGLLGYVQPWVLKRLLEDDGGIGAADALVMALSMGLLLCASILPLKLGRRRG